MGVLNWLRSIGTSWLGSWRVGTAGAELQAERAKVRPSEVTGRAWFLPWVDSLTGETQQQRLAYRLMLKDPNIKAALLDKILSVAALDLSVNPGGDEPRDKPPAEFGEHLLRRVTGGDYGLSGVPAIVETVILPGLIDGYSIAEKVWAPEQHSRRWAGKVILAKLKSKDPDKLFLLKVDEFNNIVSLVGIGANAGKEFDPASFVIWRHLSIFDAPGGMSDLRAAYRAYWAIDTAWKLRAIFLEKYAAGPMLKGTFIESGEQKSQLEASLAAAKASTWISIPEGAKVEAIDLAQRGTADFKAAIDDLKHEVFLGISGAILQALEGSTTEGRGNSQIHKSTADVRKWHLKACVESVVNTQILPDATDLNFAGVEYPQMSLGGVDDSELQSSLAVDVGLHRDLGLPLSNKDLYRRYGRPEPLSPEDTLQPVAATTAPGAPGPGGSSLNFAENPEAEKLAKDTAAAWNGREAQAQQIPDVEIDAVSAQLEGTGWLIFWNDAASNGAGAWDAQRVDEYFARDKAGVCAA